jgi:hypothetical protein
MPLLPNFVQAIVPVEKIRDYALNRDHPTGKHKALVFQRTLGIEQHNAGFLTHAIKSTLPKAWAEQGKLTPFGRLWATYHAIAGLNRNSAIVTVAWIYKKELSGIPQLVSCYIDTKRQDRLRHLLSLTE